MCAEQSFVARDHAAHIAVNSGAMAMADPGKTRANGLQLEPTMTPLQSDRPTTLGPTELAELADAELYEISSLHGDLWITQTKNRQDVIVRAGESIVLDRRGRALLGGIGAAVTVVVTPRAALAAAA
jgi:hypothetical protein